jgi:hypothetical protein
MNAIRDVTAASDRALIMSERQRAERRSLVGTPYGAENGSGVIVASLVW